MPAASMAARSIQRQRFMTARTPEMPEVALCGASAVWGVTTLILSTQECAHHWDAQKFGERVADLEGPAGEAEDGERGGGDERQRCREAGIEEALEPEEHAGRCDDHRVDAQMAAVKHADPGALAQ